jgi:hypothetical protein
MAVKWLIIKDIFTSSSKSLAATSPGDTTVKESKRFDNGCRQVFTQIEIMSSIEPVENICCTRNPDMATKYKLRPDINGRAYYFDTERQVSSILPLTETEIIKHKHLPSGYEVHHERTQGRAYYVNHKDQTISYLNPKTPEIFKNECHGTRID